jgi:hypothetical protein
MNPRDIRIAVAIPGVIWLGGWGFLYFRHPEFFAKFNRRFGFVKLSSPKYLAFVKWTGLVGMILAGISAIAVTISSKFELSWF